MTRRGHYFFASPVFVFLATGAAWGQAANDPRQNEFGAAAGPNAGAVADAARVPPEPRSAAELVERVAERYRSMHSMHVHVDLEETWPRWWGKKVYRAGACMILTRERGMVRLSIEGVPRRMSLHRGSMVTRWRNAGGDRWEKHGTYVHESRADILATHELLGGRFAPYWCMAGAVAGNQLADHWWLEVPRQGRLEALTRAGCAKPTIIVERNGRVDRYEFSTDLILQRRETTVTGRQTYSRNNRFEVLSLDETIPEGVWSAPAGPRHRCALRGKGGRSQEGG